MWICSILAAVMIVAHEPGYYTSLANHLKRWLTGAGTAAEVVTPKEMATHLPQTKTAFLVGFNEPSAAELKLLRSYRQTGGKLVVFHSASPALADLMGVKVLGYTTARYPGCWSRMDFIPERPKGFPASILQTSTVLQRAEPLPGKGRVIAWWSDRKEKPTGDAAWIETPAGWWMTHVLLADGDEVLKQQLVAAMSGNLGFEAAQRRRDEQLRAYARKQVPVRNEIHAVWDHSGCGLYPGNWAKTMHILQNARVTDLFVNVAGAGFAHYPSQVLPRSKIFQTEGDQLAACLRAAKGTGIRVHAWILTFTATRGTPETIRGFQKRGWTLRTKEGKNTEYLDPGQPAVRNYMLAAVQELVTAYPQLDGVHLDFIRYYERAKKPSDAAEIVSRFVVQARGRVVRPKWLTTAVLGKYPACIASVGQDWDSWLNAHAVDYVVPMDYSENRTKFESFLAQQGMNPAHARRTIAGIGVTANESRLDAQGVIDEINLTRKYHLAGVALFDLDTTLEKQIFPFLKLGIW